MTKTQIYSSALKRGLDIGCNNLTSPLNVLAFEHRAKAHIIRRIGCIGRNLGLKAAQGYAVNNGLTKAHARAAMQLNAAERAFSFHAASRCL